MREKESLIDDEEEQENTKTVFIQKLNDKSSRNDASPNDHLNDETSGRIYGLNSNKYNILNSLEINIDENIDTEKKCVMNNKKLLNGKYTYITCNCPTCPELGDNICYDCIKNCHKDHSGDQRNVIQRVVNITEVLCSCAECGHKAKPKSNEKNVFEKATCNIVKLFKNVHCINFYQDKKSGKFFCPFCRRNCLPSVCLRVLPFSFDKIKSNNISCCCEELKVHSKKLEDSVKYARFFTDKEIKNNVCVSQIPGALVKEKTFFKIFLSELKDIYENLKINVLTAKKIKRLNKANLITEFYLNSVRLLKNMYNSILINNSFDLDTTNTEISDIFNFEFVDSFFQLFSKLKKEMSANEITSSNDTPIIQMKVEVLYFYRLFIVIPKTKPFKKYGILLDTNNSSPIMRLIAKRNFEEFLQDLNIEKIKFIEFIKNILKTIERYDSHLMEYNISEKANSDLIYEFIEWLVILAALRYTNKDDIKGFYEDVVVESFITVIKILKRYKIDAKRIKLRIEEFVKLTILNYHDEIFYREVIASSKQKISNLLGTTSKRNNLLSTAIEGNTSKKNLNISSKKGYQELNEEEDPNDKGYEENSFSNAKFMFENTPLSFSILSSLFAFKKDPLERVVEFKDWKIYDWLASENDYYLESIKNFMLAYKSVPNNFRLLTQHLRNLSKPTFEVSSIILNKKQNVVKKMTQLSDELFSEYQKYFFSNDSPSMFCDKLIKIMNDIKNTFENNFTNETTPEDIIDRKLLQIFMIKIQLIDNLFTIYNQFQFNNYLVKNLHPSNHSILINTIFELFSLFTYDNIFNTYILFSDDSLDLFLTPNVGFSNIDLRLKSTEIDFYLKFLRNAKNYKMNLSKFVLKLKKIYFSLDDLLTKKIVDVNFKFTQEKMNLGLSTTKVKNYEKIDEEEDEDEEKIALSPEKKMERKSSFSSLQDNAKKIKKAENLKMQKIRKAKLAILADKVIEKLKTEGECYFNLNIDFSSDDLIQKIITLITCLVKTTKLSSDKSLSMTNNYILDIYNKLFRSSYFSQIWEKYKSCLDESLVDEDNQIVYGNCKKKTILVKLGDLEAASLIDTKEKITEKEHLLVLSVYHLLNKIDDNSFYILTDNIPKFEIKQLIQNKIASLPFMDRIILSFVYSRFYFVSPFNIITQLNKMNYESMCSMPDCNLNGSVLITANKSEIKKSAFSKKMNKELKGGMFGSVFVEEEKSDAEKAADDRFKYLTGIINLISEFSLGLDPLFFNLTKYRKLMKQFMKKDIVPNPENFIRYFKYVVLYPCLFGLYKVLYFTRDMTAKFKYLVYKIVVLFIQSFNYFLQTIKQNNNRFTKSEKYVKVLTNLFIIEGVNINDKDILNKTNAFIDTLLVELEKELNFLLKDPKFEPLKTQKLLVIICNYAKYFKDFSELPLFLEGKSYKLKTDNNENDNSKVTYLYQRLENFVTLYENTKTQGLEGENLLIKLFSEETPEEEPEIQQLKINIILDIVFRINLRRNKQISQYARGKEESFMIIDIINKIYKADPDLWHSTLVSISGKTKQILKDIISEYLTFTIQYIYIDFHKFPNFTLNNNESSDLTSIKKFLILLEFLRLFCENHHKIFQTILMNYNIHQFKTLTGRQEDLDLINFIIKVPIMAKFSIDYSNYKLNVLTIFKEENSDYFNDLIVGITDFLIEIIQGCFESNMRNFTLPIQVMEAKNNKNKNEEIIDKKKTKEEEQEEKMNNMLLNASQQKNTKNLKTKNELKGNVDFEKYLDCHYGCLDNLNNEVDKFFLAQFFRFLICFFEESFNPKENKEYIVRMFNPKKLLSSMSECTINLYKKYCKNLKDSNIDFSSSEQNISNNNEQLPPLNEILENNENEENLKQLTLPEKFSDKLVDIYLRKDELQENLDFIISSNIFRYLTIASQYKTAERIRQCLHELKRECEDDEPILSEKNKNNIIGTREGYRFFSEIVKEVEIFYKPKDNLPDQEIKKFRIFFNNDQSQQNEDNFKKMETAPGDVQKVVYFVDRNSLFTKETDKELFLESAPAEKNYKLNYLLEYISQFKKNMAIRKKLWKKRNHLLNVLSNINYSHAIYISVFLSILVNLLVLGSSFYENQDEVQTRNLLEENYNINNYKNEYLTKSSMLINNFTNTKINPLIFLEENSETETENEEEEKTTPEKKWPVWLRRELNTPLIVILTIINIIFIIVVIANWLYFELMKGEKDIVENEDENENGNNEQGNNDQRESFSLSETFSKLLTSETSLLLWNLIVGIIAIISVNFHFLYSVQLFTIFILIETMFTVIYSVQMKYKQFLSAGLLILIMSLFFAMLKYKWFTSDEECFTYNECFLDMIYTGIRGGAGMGFPMRKIDENRYFVEFILEWFFFFLFFLILLNVINGVIVDTFQELREKTNEENENKLNICYICSQHRGDFEKNGIDFEYHKDHEHNILNYFHYIFKVQATDEQELNSLDYQVRQSIKAKRTDFFPVNTCLSLRATKKGEDDS